MTAPSKADSELLSDVVASIRRARAALAEVVATIPGFTFQKPHDLSSALGLDPKLAWTLGRCIEETDPFVAAQFIPGPAGMRKFLQAALRSRARLDVIDAARKALQEFEVMVRLQAGNRKSFNTLATGMSAEVRVSADTEHRRRAFEGNSYIWGVHARTIFRSNVVMPASDPGRYDLAAIRGFVDFRRLRPNVAWRIAPPVSVDKARTFHHDVSREPLDPRAGAGADALPLMHDFCTQPVPQFRRVKAAFGHDEYEFVSASIGKDSCISCVTGEILHSVEPCFRDEVYDDMCFTFPVRTPARWLVMDVIIHRGIFATSAAPQPQLYSDLFAGGPGFYYEASDRLPLHEKVQYLGRGIASAVTTEIPRYTDMLRTAILRSGWDEESFEIYRMKMEYPPIPAMLMMRRPLPER